MTTRLELRSAVRRRLEDTAVTPLWDDATLNELIADAVRRYGSRFPAERSVTVVVAPGATNIPVVPAVQTEQVVRVFDPVPELVPRITELLSDGKSVSGQAWRWWNGGLLLAIGASGGTWQIDYLGARTPPADDIAAVDVIAGDEEILVLMASAAALRRRAIEDGKRGSSRSSNPLATLADTLDRDAEQRMRSRRRRIHGGHLSSPG
jgi:hypothetical protein